MAQEEQEEEQRPRVGSTILNDTTENLYGPTTVEYFYSSAITNNTREDFYVDTSVYDLHQFSFVDFHNKRYQDLGNIGTAIRPIYYQFQENIGRTTGFDAFDLYFKDAEQVKFYDTQSPYSRLGIILGGEGRALTEAEYTRNIDYRSNIGFSYRGIFADEQVERAGRGDRNVEGIYYNFHGNYHTINRKYWLLASFVRNSQNVDEYGGILNATPETPFEMFFEDTIRVSLNNTQGRDLRRQYYVYHEYHVSDIMEVFHEFQHYDQLMTLTTDTDADPEQRVLPSPVLTNPEFALLKDTTKVHDTNKYDEWSNRVGLSGTVGDGFYKVYYQQRKLIFNYKHLDFDTTGIEGVQYENLAGINIRIGNEPERQLFGQFDYLEGGFYNFQGRLSFKPFYASVRQMKRKPALMETIYRGTFNEYHIEVNDPVTSEIKGGILHEGEKLRINAYVNLQRLTDYIYFAKDLEGRTRAFQNEGTVTALLPGVEVQKWWGEHWLTKAEAIYSTVGGDNPEVYPLPTIFSNFQASYNDISFNSNLEWQLGVDVHLKSPYFARGYDPLIQQFFVQDVFEIPGAPIIDIFLNAKINRARIFVKYINLFQAFKGYGHIPTPYYPGQIATLDFGVNWSFYD